MSEIPLVFRSYGYKNFIKQLKTAEKELKDLKQQIINARKEGKSTNQLFHQYKIATEDVKRLKKATKEHWNTVIKDTQTAIHIMSSYKKAVQGALDHEFELKKKVREEHEKNKAAIKEEIKAIQEITRDLKASHKTREVAMRKEAQLRKISLKQVRDEAFAARRLIAIKNAEAEAQGKVNVKKREGKSASKKLSEAQSKSSNETLKAISAMKSYTKQLRKGEMAASQFEEEYRELTRMGAKFNDQQRKAITTEMTRAKRIRAASKIMQQYGLSVKKAFAAFKTQFGAEYTKKDLKEIENRLRKIALQARKTGNKTEDAMKIMKRGVQETSKSLGFLNTKWGTMSIVMSGIAATLFVWQEFLQLMRLLFSETLKVEKAMAKLHITISASSKIMDKMQGDIQKVAEQTGSEFDKTAEAFEKLARETNNIESALSLLPSVMLMMRSGVIDVDTAIEEAVHHTWGLEEAWKKSGKAANESIGGAGKRLKKEVAGLTVDLLGDAFWEEFIERITEAVKEVRKIVQPENDVSSWTAFWKKVGAVAKEELGKGPSIAGLGTLSDFAEGSMVSHLMPGNIFDMSGLPLEIEIKPTLNVSKEEIDAATKDVYSMLGITTTRQEKIFQSKQKTLYDQRVRALKQSEDTELIVNAEKYANLMKEQEEYQRWVKENHQRIRADQQKFQTSGIATDFFKKAEQKKIDNYTKTLQGVDKELRQQINTRMKLGLVMKFADKEMQREQKLFRETGILTAAYIEANEHKVQATAAWLRDMQTELKLGEDQISNILEAMQQRPVEMEYEQKIKYHKAYYNKANKMTDTHYNMQIDALNRYFKVYMRDIGDLEAASELFYRNVIDLEEQRVRASDDFGKGIIISIEQMRLNMETWGEFAIDKTQEIAKGMEKGFTKATASMLMGNLNAWDDYFNTIKSMFASILAEMITIAMKNKIIVPIIYSAMGETMAGAIGGAAGATAAKGAGAGWLATTWDAPVPGTGVGSQLGYIDVSIGEVVSGVAAVKSSVDSLKHLQEGDYGYATYDAMKAGAWTAAAFQVPYALPVAIALEVGDLLGFDDQLEGLFESWGIGAREPYTTTYGEKTMKWGQLPDFGSTFGEAEGIGTQEVRDSIGQAKRDITNAAQIMAVQVYDVLEDWFLTLPDAISGPIFDSMENFTFKLSSIKMNWEEDDPQKLIDQFTAALYEHGTTEVLARLERMPGYSMMADDSIGKMMPGILRKQAIKAQDSGSVEDWKAAAQATKAFTDQLNQIESFVDGIGNSIRALSGDVPDAVFEFENLVAGMNSMKDTAIAMDLNESVIKDIEKIAELSEEKFFSDLADNMDDLRESVLGLDDRTIDEINNKYDDYIDTLAQTGRSIDEVNDAERERTALINEFHQTLIRDVNDLYESIVNPKTEMQEMTESFTDLIEIMISEEVAASDVTNALEQMNKALIFTSKSMDFGSNNPFASLMANIESYLEGRERSDWTLEDWRTEFDSLLDKYNGLDPASEYYFTDALDVLSDQFDALKSIDSKMDEEISALQSLQSNIDTALNDLLYGQASPVTTPGSLETRYGQLLQDAQGSMASEDIQAFVDFATGTFIPYMQTFTGEGANYRLVVDQVASDLGAFGSDIETQLEVLQEIRDKVSTENTLWSLYGALSGWAALSGSGVTSYGSLEDFTSSSIGQTAASVGGYSSVSDMTAASTQVGQGVSMTPIGDVGYMYTAAHQWLPGQFETAFSSFEGMGRDELGFTNINSPYQTSSGIEGLLSGSPHFQREAYFGMDLSAVMADMRSSLNHSEDLVRLFSLAGMSFTSADGYSTLNIYPNPLDASDLTVRYWDGINTYSNPYQPDMDINEYFRYLGSVKDQWPTYAMGGLASSASIFAESGPEWAVPAYTSPYNENFLKSVGIDKVAEGMMTHEDAQQIIGLLNIIAQNSGNPAVVPVNIGADDITGVVNRTVNQNPAYFPAIANKHS